MTTCCCQRSVLCNFLTMNLAPVDPVFAVQPNCVLCIVPDLNMAVSGSLPTCFMPCYFTFHSSLGLFSLKTSSNMSLGDIFSSYRLHFCMLHLLLFIFPGQTHYFLSVFGSLLHVFNTFQLTNVVISFQTSLSSKCVHRFA